jgi:hypothetical protein
LFLESTWLVGDYHDDDCALKFHESADGNKVEVRSPQLSTVAGFHYCKVLSPARAIEWMYVDGLRAKYSLKAMNATAGPDNSLQQYNSRKEDNYKNIIVISLAVALALTAVALVGAALGYIYYSKSATGAQLLSAQLQRSDGAE